MSMVFTPSTFISDPRGQGGNVQEQGIEANRADHKKEQDSDDPTESTKEGKIKAVE